ncbi:MAG TPA: tryptophan synthase subunit alpha [Spirochaetales bacterium]|nr:tryptophan synthase subunit alpha [Spirochaetales bacterium]
MTIKELFLECKKEKIPALIGYLPAGYPTSTEFIERVHQAALAGLGCMEIGIPTRDTNLDGIVISTAMNQVVNQGISFENALSLAGQALCSAGIPGIGMLYYSTLEKLGETAVFSLLRQHGIEGILVPNIPLRQWDSYAASASTYGLSPIGFISADMDVGAVHQVASATEGFLYLQAYPGTTGDKIVINESIRTRVMKIKKIAAGRNLPVAVGFGIRSGDDALKLRNMGADGIIIGTALVEASTRGGADLADFISLISEAVAAGGGDKK